MSRVLACLLVFASISTIGARAATPSATPAAAAPKIEVIEFFSYGCPHCYDFEPLVKSWLRQQPKDVVFRRVPISLGHPQWVALSKAYYAFEATRHLDKLDDAIFKAIHNGASLWDADSIARWAGTQGVDASEITNAMNSFSINTKTAQAESLAVQYSIEATPTLMVAGKVVPEGSLEGMLKTADEMIGRARAAMVARK